MAGWSAPAWWWSPSVAARSNGMQVQVMRDETEVEAVRRARDSILANIAHGSALRFPLRKWPLIELLKDGLAEMPREQLEELVGSLQRATLRLTRLIDNSSRACGIEAASLRIRRRDGHLHRSSRMHRNSSQGLLRSGASRCWWNSRRLPLVYGDGAAPGQVVTKPARHANKFGPEAA